MGLETRGIVVRFGGRTAVDDVDIDAAAGTITGLIGPNGAGKTTLFNVITGVLKPASGRVLLNGESLDGMAPHRRARLGLGRTFQRLELFGSLTVRENIKVAADWHAPSRAEATSTVDQLLERLQLGDVADVLTSSLSTGTGRVVELARCMAARPQVLLLDEPASGQDDTESARFSAVLRQLADDGMAILLVEHDMDLVMRVCERIHVLDFGSLLASGTPAEVQADPHVRAAYLGEEDEA
jgi:branched-chain amino acid transport system ATP-binding protein